jgi:hypothetical protein
MPQHTQQLVLVNLEFSIHVIYRGDLKLVTQKT